MCPICDFTTVNVNGQLTINIARNQMVPSRVERRVRWTTRQPRLSAIVQARRLSLFSDIVWIPDETDAKKILTASPFAELEETTGTPTYYMDEDYPAGPEIQQPLPKWNNWYGSESSTLETDVYVWRYALLVVQVQTEEKQKKVTRQSHIQRMMSNLDVLYFREHNAVLHDGHIVLQYPATFFDWSIIVTSMQHY